MSNAEPSKKIGWPGVAAAAVGLVVASTTFAGNFNGWGTAGSAYIIAIAVGFAINLFVMWAYAELTTMFPKEGQIYEFTKQAFDRGSLKKWGTRLAAGAGTSYWLIFGLVFAAEATAGASAMVSTTGIGNVSIWVLGILLIALAVNLFGLKISMGLELLLVAIMVGVRVLIGLAGFTGMNQVGSWQMSHVVQGFSPIAWGALFGVLTLGFWAFVGLEFATPLVEETRNPSKNIPKGMFIGVMTILVMGLIMGFGVMGVINPATNQGLYTGNAPQIEIAGMLLGGAGVWIAGIASFAATLGSVNVAFAAIPRIIQAMAREGLWPKQFAWMHPKYDSPWPATVLTFFLFLIPTLFSGQVVEMINAATVVWLLAYVWIFVLAIKMRFSHSTVTRPFSVPQPIYGAGILLTLFVLWRAYQGAYWLIGLGIGIGLIGFAFSAIWTSINGQPEPAVSADD
jgi:amino acid transporter